MVFGSGGDRGVATATTGQYGDQQSQQHGDEEQDRGTRAVPARSGHHYFPPEEFKYADMTWPPSVVASPEPPLPAFCRNTAIAIGGVWPFFPA